MELFTSKMIWILDFVLKTTVGGGGKGLRVEKKQEQPCIDHCWSWVRGP